MLTTPRKLLSIKLLGGGRKLSELAVRSQVCYQAGEWGSDDERGRRERSNWVFSVAISEGARDVDERPPPSIDIFCLFRKGKLLVVFRLKGELL